MNRDKDDYNVSIVITHQVKEYLDQLVDDGIFGKNIQEICARMIDRRIEEMIHDGTFLERRHSEAKKA